MTDITSLIQPNQDMITSQELALRAAAESYRLLAINPTIKEILKGAQLQQDLVRAALEPFGDLRSAGMLAADFSVDSEMVRTVRTIADYEARFRLPEIQEIARLAAEAISKPWKEAWRTWSEETASAMRQAMERMRTPWLDIREQDRSLASFAELQNIGHALRTTPTFDANLVAALRLDLGDWRDAISWRPEELTDISARSDFYADLGFNEALTDFPAPAFQESLDAAGLRRERPTLVDLYGDPIPRASNKHDEEALARTNKAHDWLQRLESQLRAFIDEHMTQSFGANWAKHRLPNGLYDRWQEKKRTADQAGVPARPLIVYADFTDYERIITKGDNWRDIFAAFFGRKEDVRESFQRLYPIRVDTMHARLITQDDELLLYVETRRLVKVIVNKS